MLIDTHAHLYWESYKEDLDEVIKRSIEAGVTTIFNVGVDVKLSQIAAEQTENKLNKIPNFKAYSTIGIHPHEAINYHTSVSIHKDIEELEKIYQSIPDQSFDSFDSTQDRSAQDKIIAVGECGLDFKFDSNDHHLNASLPLEKIKNLQRKLFKAQIDLAKKLNLPLIVHCRDDRSKDPLNTEAWDEVIDMTKNNFGIYHCYSGLLQTTNYLLQTTNYLISFAGNITYPKNEYLREVVKILPLDRICFETDSPFLAPQSKRGQRNEPASVREIAELVANLKGVSLEEVSDQTTANVKKLFRLS